MLKQKTMSSLNTPANQELPSYHATMPKEEAVLNNPDDLAHQSETNKKIQQISALLKQSQSKENLSSEEKVGKQDYINHNTKVNEEKVPESVMNNINSESIAEKKGYQKNENSSAISRFFKWIGNKFRNLFRGIKNLFTHSSEPQLEQTDTKNSSATLSNNKKKQSMKKDEEKNLADVFLKEAKINGGRVTFENGKKKTTPSQVTAELLKEKGLAPKRYTKIDGVQFGVSDRFMMGHRDVAIVYVRSPSQEKGKEGKTVTNVCVYYKSGSQAVWRLQEGQTKDGWLAKGHGEESMNAPIDLQELLESTNIKNFDENDAYPIVGGLVNTYDTSDDYFRDRETPYQKEMSEEAKYKLPQGKPVDFKDADGNVRTWRDKKTGKKKTRKDEHRLANPQTLDVKRVLGEDGVPDFKEKPVKTFERTSLVYGGKDKKGKERKITSEVYLSKDKRYKYVINRTDDNLVWVGQIEIVGSEITSQGLRKDFIDTGNVDMPLYEYDQQTVGENGELYYDSYSREGDPNPRKLRGDADDASEYSDDANKYSNDANKYSNDAREYSTMSDNILGARGHKIPKEILKPLRHDGNIPDVSEDVREYVRQYVRMWDYVSKTPLIQDYLKAAKEKDKNFQPNPDAERDRKNVPRKTSNVVTYSHRPC